MFNILDAREQLQMSQEKLAQKSGVSRTIISGLESGTITTTTTSTLLKISRALGRKINEIFFDD